MRVHQAMRNRVAVVVSEKYDGQKRIEISDVAASATARAAASRLVQRCARLYRSAALTPASKRETSHGTPTTVPNVNSAECPGGYLAASTGSTKTWYCQKNSGRGRASATARPEAKIRVWSR
jgi:hypothetical protein